QLRIVYCTCSVCEVGTCLLVTTCSAACFVQLVLFLYLRRECCSRLQLQRVMSPGWLLSFSGRLRLWISGWTTWCVTRVSLLFFPLLVCMAGCGWVPVVSVACEDSKSREKWRHAQIRGNYRGGTPE
ncbi:unnamed protein product, partial [Hapterophycus canaliculatus]